MYEYQCVSIWGKANTVTQKLNDFGGDGWELVFVSGTWHYLKRRKNNTPEVKTNLVELFEERIRLLEENNSFLIKLLEKQTDKNC